MRALKAAMLSQRLTLGIGAILLVVSAASIGMDVESRTDVARVDHTLDVLSRIAMCVCSLVSRERIARLCDHRR